jgi:hypothetical protein
VTVELPEYLYLDSPRLDNYVELFAPPVTYDKVAEVGGEFGLTGPKVKATQIRAPRERTIEEKITLLKEKLREQGRLAERRITTGIGEAKAEFRIESCKAVQLFIPPATPESVADDAADYPDELDLASSILRRGDPRLDAQNRNAARRRRDREIRARLGMLEGLNGLTIWYSPMHCVDTESQPKHNELYLVPDSRKRDEPVAFGSAYSALISLYQLTEPELSEIARRSISGSGLYNPESALQKAFIRDPVKAMVDLGAIVKGERHITSLYRLREILPARESCFITFGTPIWISASAVHLGRN